MTKKEACVAYQIKSPHQVSKWIRDFQKEEKIDICGIEALPMPDDSTNKPQPDKAEALKKALQEAEMKIIALNTMIDIAEEKLKIDIRKKSGAKQSSD